MHGRTSETGFSLSVLAMLLLAGLTTSSLAAQQPPCQAATLEEALECVRQLVAEAEPAQEPSLAERCAGLDIFACVEVEKDRIKKETEEKANGLRKEAKRMKNEAVGEMNEKMTPANSAGTASAVIDTFSAFLASFGIDGVSESDGNLNLDFNPKTLGRGPVQVSYGVTLNKPAVYEPLKQAIPEDLRDDEIETLEGEFGDFDSIDLRLRLSLENGPGHKKDANSTYRLKKRYYGRDVTKYMDLLSDGLYNLADDAFAELEPLEDRVGDQLAERGLFNATFPSEEPEAEANDATVLTEAQVLEVSGMIQEFAEASVPAFKDFDTTLKQGALYSLADLVSNQPQFSLLTTFKERDGATGPSSKEWELEYSWSRLNVNGFLRWSRQARDSEDETTPAEKNCRAEGIHLECLNRFLDHKDVKPKDLPRTLKMKPRYSFSLKYTETDAFTFQVPLPEERTLDFASGELSKWVGTAKIGKILRLDKEDNEQARFDFEVNYEDVSGNAMAMAQILPLDPDAAPMEMMEMATPSRLVATATYSENLPGNLVASFSAVWANKADFLEDVNEELTARFGIKWSIGKKPDPDSGDDSGQDD